jgi:hypothetical protein
MSPHTSSAGTPAACAFEEPYVDVDADKAARPQPPGELWERDARAATNLKDAGTARHA